jgi:hypothetical protein
MLLIGSELCPSIVELGGMSRLSELQDKFRSLPWLLRITTIALIILGAAVAITPLVPGMIFNFDGIEMGWRELWQTRVALALLLLGPLMISVGLGVLHARLWVRPALLLLPFIQLIPFYLVHWIFGAPSPIRSISVGTYFLLCLLWAVLATPYLYGRSAVRRHFANTA